MSTDAPTATRPDTTAEAADSEGPLDREALQQALEHRFRHTLSKGQISPLLHLVMRYKLEVAPCHKAS